MNEENTNEKEVDGAKFVKPDDYFDIMVNGDTRSVFMSAGMLRIITTIISELEDYSAIYTEPAMQERCLVELLVDRDHRGKPIDTDPTTGETSLITDLSDISLMVFEMSSADCAKMTKWMGDHALYFFIEGAMNMTDVVTKQGQSLQNLMHSLDGLKP